jgi:hypothetical protein
MPANTTHCCLLSVGYWLLPVVYLLYVPQSLQLLFQSLCLHWPAPQSLHLSLVPIAAVVAPPRGLLLFILEFRFEASKNDLFFHIQPGARGWQGPYTGGGLPLLGPAAGGVGLPETHVSDGSFPA